MAASGVCRSVRLYQSPLIAVTCTATRGCRDWVALDVRLGTRAAGVTWLANLVVFLHRAAHPSRAPGIAGRPATQPSRKSPIAPRSRTQIAAAADRVRLLVVHAETGFSCLERRGRYVFQWVPNTSLKATVLMVVRSSSSACGRTTSTIKACLIAGACVTPASSGSTALWPQVAPSALRVSPATHAASSALRGMSGMEAALPLLSPASTVVPLHSSSIIHRQSARSQPAAKPTGRRPCASRATLIRKGFVQALIIVVAKLAQKTVAIARYSVGLITLTSTGTPTSGARRARRNPWR
mmetsp:Transcript_6044/g.16654  ORF Transcript_6044/g.16654 Transcript_6044/m.16654 type:complete len:296 (+) Transcript_6044:935-1822(+)